MIDPILTLSPTLARDIPPFTIVQIWDAEVSDSRLVMCKGHTETWSVFAYNNGYTFRVLGSETLSVVTDTTDWAGMDNDTRIDIELALMIEGA